MQEALRFLQPDAEPLDRADFVEQARAARHGSHAPSRGLPLTIRGLQKSFGDNEVLRGIDLHIPAGPVRRHRRPQRLRQEHAAAVDRGARDHRRRHHQFW